ATLTGPAPAPSPTLSPYTTLFRSGTEGATNSSVLSGATFTDANPGDHTGDFTATIHWGDTTSSSGTVSFSAGVYTVDGTHTYADIGRANIRIPVTDAARMPATTTS